jgi:hypothetical protein
MSFNIISYVDKVRERLETLPAVKRLVFSLWCIQPLLDEFSDNLGKHIGADNLSLLQAAVNQIWNCVITGTTDQTHLIQQASDLAKSIEWSEDDMGSDEESLNDGAIELVINLTSVFQVVETGSSMYAAGTVEGIINVIYYELEMIEGVDDPLSDRRLLDEIGRQKQMLLHLETEQNLSNEDRRRFRS